MSSLLVSMKVTPAPMASKTARATNDFDLVVTATAPPRALAATAALGMFIPARGTSAICQRRRDPVCVVR